MACRLLSGAFLAGMVLSESQFSQRAARETLPLQDAFAVLFFVAVGMLFDPQVLIEQPWKVVATVAIIVRQFICRGTICVADALSTQHRTHRVSGFGADR